MHMDVAGVARTILIKTTPEEAAGIKAWFDALPSTVRGQSRPHGLSEFYGAMAAIAQHREYGGH